MSEEFEWSEPTRPNTHRRTNGSIIRFVAQLKTRPGQWAVMTKTFMGNLSDPHYKHKDVEWHVEANYDSEGNRTGTKTVYGRYVPK